MIPDALYFNRNASALADIMTGTYAGYHPNGQRQISRS